MTRLAVLAALLATAIAAALLARARRRPEPGPDFREPYDEAGLFV